jgi:hypothetical protein
LRVAVVAVVDAQPSAAAVFARLGDVGAQVLDDEPDAAGREAGDALAGLRVRRLVVIAAEQGVDELRRWLRYTAEGSAVARRVPPAGFWRWRGARGSA